MGLLSHHEMTTLCKSFCSAWKIYGENRLWCTESLKAPHRLMQNAAEKITLRKNGGVIVRIHSVPFSAERLMQMLDYRAQTCQVTLLGRLHIAVNGVYCVLTQQAVATLAEQYQQRHDWQQEYPNVSRIFFNARATAS